MDDRQRAAAECLAIGTPMKEVCELVGRTAHTVHKWVRNPEFQAEMIRGIRASALLTLAGYLKTGEDVKAGQAALATLRWLGAGKPKPRGSPKEPEAGDDPDDPDLGEFSADSLRRLKGEG